MGLAANLAVGLVAIIHVGIGIVEMFLWIRPAIHTRLRPKVDVNEAEAREVAPIVANVGLYNWFVAAGLLWTLMFPGLGLLPADGVVPIRVFFLGFVMIAGVYGAATISRNILVIQTIPAALALLFVWLGRGG